MVACRNDKSLRRPLDHGATGLDQFRIFTVIASAANPSRATTTLIGDAALDCSHGEIRVKFHFRMTVLSVFSIAGPSLVVGFRVLPEQAHIRSSPVCDGPPFRIRGQGSGGEASPSFRRFQGAMQSIGSPPRIMAGGHKPRRFSRAPAARPGGSKTCSGSRPQAFTSSAASSSPALRVGQKPDLAKARSGGGAGGARLHDHALRDDALRHIFPQGDEQLARQRHDHGLAARPRIRHPRANHSDSADCG